ncbi:MAG: protein kinase [Deltaproteobacteria bacterium]|nr:protein kinase [Deltaproteobacteria bacterium]
MLATGTIIGERYRVLRALGSGGMATVYEAEHLSIGQRVAIKVLHPHLARKSDLVSRFEDEARTATRINHEHIVAVTDLGRHGEVPFMAMEYLQGESLADKMDREHVLSVPAAMHLLDQILAALEAVHAAGVVHRDLKPANIFLIERAGIPDYVKLLDFGVSKARFEARAKGRAATRSGIVMGTPQYMAPEQALGHRDLDARADVYSAGVLLYEMVTGLLPFDAPGHSEVIVMVATHHPPPVPAGAHRLDLPVAVDQAIATAMRFSREERFQNATAFRQAVRPWVPALSAFGREVSNPMIAIPERSHHTPVPSVEVMPPLPAPEEPHTPPPTQPFGLVPVRAGATPVGAEAPAATLAPEGSALDAPAPSPPERSPRPSAQTVPPAALKPRQPSGHAPALGRGAFGPGLLGLVAGVLLGVGAFALREAPRGDTGASTASLASTAAPRPAASRVRVVTTPTNALVEVDRQARSELVLTALAPGDHAVRVTAPGHAPYQGTVQLAPGSREERWVFTLAPLPVAPTASPNAVLAVPEARVTEPAVTPEAQPADAPRRRHRRHRDRE